MLHASSQTLIVSNLEQKNWSLRY